MNKKITIGLLLLTVIALVGIPQASALDGAALYASNCQDCHGALASSTKLDRTASQIQNAITNVNAMKSLSTLTPAEIQAIADALDKTPPVITPPPDVSVEASVPATVDIGMATATDNSGVAPIITNDAPATFGLGDTIVTWTATDGAGNSASATQKVTVTQPPANQPPANQPPANEPPANQPPANQPPANEPPANEPPANEPPANEPPANEPPANEPPVIELPTLPPNLPPTEDEDDDEVDEDDNEIDNEVDNGVDNEVDGDDNEVDNEVDNEDDNEVDEDDDGDSDERLIGDARKYNRQNKD